MRTLAWRRLVTEACDPLTTSGVRARRTDEKLRFEGKNGSTRGHCEAFVSMVCVQDNCRGEKNVEGQP
jgi:hypothetical protein